MNNFTEAAPNVGPHTAKFLEWYRSEKSKGLVDAKFFTGDVQNSTPESFFAEVNEMIEAESVNDPDFF